MIISDKTELSRLNLQLSRELLHNSFKLGISQLSLDFRCVSLANLYEILWQSYLRWKYNQRETSDLCRSLC